MEVILNQDIEKLGYKEDIVKVKNGFARNYLIPKGLAIIASDGNKKVLEENMRQAKVKKEKILTEARNLAAKLENKILKIGAKAAENGKIYGSVTPLQIAEAIKDLGVPVDRRKVKIDSEIKELGEYTARVELHKEVRIEMTFEVVAE